MRNLPERSLTRRERWPLYAGGMITETLYVLALTGAALALAFVAKLIWL